MHWWVDLIGGLVLYIASWLAGLKGIPSGSAKPRKPGFARSILRLPSQKKVVLQLEEGRKEPKRMQCPRENTSYAITGIKNGMVAIAKC